MTQIYRHKWEASEGEILDARGNYTAGFLLWCRKTEHLTDEEWRRGFDVIESEIMEAEKIGNANNLWPPSYPAFIEKCKAAKNLSLYKSFPRYRQLEDKTAKKKRYKKGVEECGKILSMFDE